MNNTNQIKQTMNDLQKHEKFYRKHCPAHDYINVYDHDLDFGINRDFALWELEMRKYV